MGSFAFSLSTKISRKTVPFSVVLRRTRRRRFVALIRCKHTTMPPRYQAASRIFCVCVDRHPVDYRVRDPICGFPNARYEKLEGFVLQWNRIVGIVRKMFIRLSEHQVTMCPDILSSICRSMRRKASSVRSP